MINLIIKKEILLEKNKLLLEIIISFFKLFHVKIKSIIFININFSHTKSLIHINLIETIFLIDKIYTQQQQNNQKELKFKPI